MVFISSARKRKFLGFHKRAIPPFHCCCVDWLMEAALKNYIAAVEDKSCVCLIG